MREHKQVICKTLEGNKFEVDEKIAPFVQRLCDAGIKTWVSCQWEGPQSKKYPAYINPCIPEHGYISSTPEEMAKVLGLKKWQWRQYNGVLWLHRSLVK